MGATVPGGREGGRANGTLRPLDFHVIFGRIERDWRHRSRASPNLWLVGLMFSLMAMTVNWFCEFNSTLKERFTLDNTMHFVTMKCN
jgi:hypothetical protein